MFSKEERCIYKSNQLADVICQLRFPEILSIAAKLPADFQDRIRDVYPRYSSSMDNPAPKLKGKPGQFSVENQPGTINYQFTSEDGIWRINLTSRFISLSCNQYTSWEEFAKRLDKPLAAFIQVYEPAFFERVGLRYLNFISKKDLQLTDIPFAELIQPQYLGILGDEDIQEHQATRASVDAELSIRHGCRVKIHAGPGMVTRNGKQDSEVKFIFDQDLSMSGNIPVNYAAGTLEALHSQAYPIFRAAITDTLHEAMEPTDIL
ncbi:MAG: TIGR04255 family protein [Oscillospiraceae bacterium]|nr:TIGR04255 family protein [Oscillospiraceae bacterium]